MLIMSFAKFEKYIPYGGKDSKSSLTSNVFNKKIKTTLSKSEHLNFLGELLLKLRKSYYSHRDFQTIGNIVAYLN